MHQSISLARPYLGTPVVLVGTVNENGSFNLAPMSSAFWLGLPSGRALTAIGI